MGSATATVVRPSSRSKLDEVFKALGSTQRREILRILSASTPEAGKTCCAPHELCGCKLSEQMGLVASTISHHMGVLRRAGLVTARRDGQWVYYTLCRDVLTAAGEELERL